ncbi:MAG: hypothetical protein FJ351_04565 [Sphingomonadales bacterium]|nr:hypothetical protein [Sphingomonadales bacterium]
MNKQELTETVELIYAMWNKELPVNIEAKKMTYRAWNIIIGDLPQTEVIEASKRLTSKETYLPTAGLIRTEHRRMTIKEPTAAQAWNQYTHIRDAINSGTTQYEPPHPRLQKTIQQVGLNLHTNDDRRHFTETYNTVEETQ